MTQDASAVLAGRITMITGAGSGIGAAGVRRFVAAGATVVAVGRSGAERVVAREVGARVMPLHANVTRDEDLQRVFDAIDCEFGQLDVLFNNAGGAGLPNRRHLDIDAAPREHIELMWRTNLRAQMVATALAVPLLKRTAGTVINTASVAAHVGHPFMAPYAASKAAVLGLTRSSAAELGPFGIRVNALVPGQIATGQSDHLTQHRIRQLAETTALKRRGSPDEVARVAVFLASDAASFITGVALTVDGGRSL